MMDTAMESKLEETKRTSRILEIVLMISASPKRYLRKHLAVRFEVGVRMIQKDLDVIRNGLKLPLVHTRSGYYFDETPQLPALQYKFTEALALLTAVQAAQQVSGIGSVELSAAVVRLEALFPVEFQPLLRQARTPPPMTAQREHRQEMLSLLNRALLYRNKLQIVYATGSRGGAISQRIVQPYHIFPYVRSWQLIAYCEKRTDIIMFKVDRIQEATMLPDTTYQVASDFNPDEYIGNVWGVMRGVETEPEEIELRFTPQAGRWVAEEFWHKSQQVEEQEDESVMFRLHIAITPEFVNWLLYYGSRVEVVQPAYLRERVAEEHRNAAAQYEQGG